jgi:hypothetical protein
MDHKPDDDIVPFPLVPMREGDTVVVERIHEDLEEIWRRLQYLRGKLAWLDYRMQVTFATLGDDQKRDLQRERNKTGYEAAYREREFWFKANDRYDLWSRENIGIREGYCLVEYK